MGEASNTDTAAPPDVAESDEAVDQFRARARAWLAENMPPIDPAFPPAANRDEEHCWQRARELQKRLYEGGFAGICFPRAYGGLGLDYEYQQAFDEESLSYEMPLILNTPTFTICCATLLDRGSEEQKRRHIAAALRGDEVLVQLLSEPSGGSDLAGVITRAERDGDRWVINGAKTWSTSAFAADYGLCLARTDWDVPKHDGLTMFLVPIKHPGITLRRITQLNGSTEFCEEFLDGVDVGDDAVVGDVNGGWAVASQQLYHERRAVGQGSEFASGSGSEGGRSTPVNYPALAEVTGQADNERVQQIAGRALVHRAVSDQLGGHVYRSVRDGSLPPAAGTLIRLFHAETVTLEMDAGLAITGTAGVVGAEGEGLQTGLRYLSRQTVAIGGGTTEMARNVIGERVLNFPREYAADRGVPFSQVRHSNKPRRADGAP
jgi:alkylation response protein AidB-like acyl-CoA dehydrogenase